MSGGQQVADAGGSGRSRWRPQLPNERRPAPDGLQFSATARPWRLASPRRMCRAGLVEAARSSDCRLVAVTAPAGYGKSMFLAEWAAAAEDWRVVWVSLDR